MTTAKLEPPTLHATASPGMSGDQLMAKLHAVVVELGAGSESEAAQTYNVALRDVLVELHIAEFAPLIEWLDGGKTTGLGLYVDVGKMLAPPDGPDECPEATSIAFGTRGPTVLEEDGSPLCSISDALMRKLGSLAGAAFAAEAEVNLVALDDACEDRDKALDRVAALEAQLAEAGR